MDHQTSMALATMGDDELDRCLQACRAAMPEVVYVNHPTWGALSLGLASVLVEYQLRGRAAPQLERVLRSRRR